MKNALDISEQDAVGFVLAGGRSSRMGADKALVELCGEPLVVHALRILHHAGLSVSIVGGRSSLDAFAPVVADIEPDRGPLTGVTSALAELSSRIAVFIPIDMPLLPPSLVTLLLHHAVKTGARSRWLPLADLPRHFRQLSTDAACPRCNVSLPAPRAAALQLFRKPQTRSASR